MTYDPTNNTSKMTQNITTATLNALSAVDENNAAAEVISVLTAADEGISLTTAAENISVHPSFTCVICNKHTIGYGNNTKPLKLDGGCCDSCNMQVIFTRLKAIFPSDVAENMSIFTAAAAEDITVLTATAAAEDISILTATAGAENISVLTAAVAENTSIFTVTAGEIIFGLTCTTAGKNISVLTSTAGEDAITFTITAGENTFMFTATAGKNKSVLTAPVAEDKHNTYKYCGWPNYATWLINLECFHDSPAEDLGITHDNKEDAPEILRDWFENVVMNEFPENTVKYYCQKFVDDVDWRAIAKEVVESMEDEEEYEAEDTEDTEDEDTDTDTEDKKEATEDGSIADFIDEDTEQMNCGFIDSEADDEVAVTDNLTSNRNADEEKPDYDDGSYFVDMTDAGRNTTLSFTCVLCDEYTIGKGNYPDAQLKLEHARQSGRCCDSCHLQVLNIKRARWEAIEEHNKWCRENLDDPTWFDKTCQLLNSVD